MQMQMRQVVLYESVEMLFSLAIKATDLHQKIEILTTQEIEALFALWNFIHLFADFQCVCRVFLIAMSFDLRVQYFCGFAMNKR